MRENDARKALDEALARLAAQQALHGGYKARALELEVALERCRTAHAETMRLLDEMTGERDRINRDADRHARRSEQAEAELAQAQTKLAAVRRAWRVMSREFATVFEDAPPPDRIDTE